MVEESNIMIWALQGVWLVLGVVSSTALAYNLWFPNLLSIPSFFMVIGCYIMFRKGLNYEKEEVVAYEHNTEVVDEKEERTCSAA